MTRRCTRRPLVREDTSDIMRSFSQRVMALWWVAHGKLCLAGRRTQGLVVVSNAYLGRTTRLMMTRTQREIRPLASCNSAGLAATFAFGSRVWSRRNERSAAGHPI